MTTIAGVQSQDDISGNVQRAWAEIISLMRATNEEMFATPARIGEIVRSRSYFGMLQKYKPMLEEWLTRFQQLQSTHLRCFDEIEFRLIAR